MPESTNEKLDQDSYKLEMEVGLVPPRMKEPAWEEVEVEERSEDRAHQG